MSRGLRLYVEQLWRLTVSEFKLREQSTLLGFLWTLLQPLLLFAVLFGLFTRWMGRRPGDYAAYLLIGIVQYGFFTGGSTVGLTSLGRRSALLLNFKIPRDVVVLSAVSSVALSYLLELALMLCFVAAAGARPQSAWALFPVLVLIHVAFVGGLCLWLAVVAARYPDWERIWGILTTAGFFLTPIFYTLDSVSPRRRFVLLLNPMTHIVEMTRGCLLQGRAPDPWRLASIAALSAALCAGGWVFFKRHEPRLADYVAV